VTKEQQLKKLSCFIKNLNRWDRAKAIYILPAVLRRKLRKCSPEYVSLIYRIFMRNFNSFKGTGKICKSAV